MFISATVQIGKLTIFLPDLCCPYFYRSHQLVPCVASIRLASRWSWPHCLLGKFAEVGHHHAECSKHIHDMGRWLPHCRSIPTSGSHDSFPARRSTDATLYGTTTFWLSYCQLPCSSWVLVRSSTRLMSYSPDLVPLQSRISSFFTSS